jgi:hypothetical protein
MRKRTPGLPLLVEHWARREAEAAALLRKGSDWRKAVRSPSTPIFHFTGAPIGSNILRMKKRSLYGRWRSLMLRGKRRRRGRRVAAAGRYPVLPYHGDRYIDSFSSTRGNSSSWTVYFQ